MKGSWRCLLGIPLLLVLSGCIEGAGVELLEKEDLEGPWTWTPRDRDGVELAPPRSVRWVIAEEQLFAVDEFGCADGVRPAECFAVAFLITEHVEAEGDGCCLFGPERDRPPLPWYERSLAILDWSQAMLPEGSLIVPPEVSSIRLSAGETADPLAHAERDLDGSVRAFAVPAHYRDATCDECPTLVVEHTFEAAM